MDFNQIISDFQRRYAGTYIHVVFPGESNENLFFLDSVTPDGGERLAVLNLHSPEYGHIKLNYGTAHTLKFNLPCSGVFQNGKDACIFRRDPQRQWRVGVYSGNSSIFPVHCRIYTSHIENQLNFEDVANAYAGVTSSFKDALSYMESGKYRSVAMRNDYSLLNDMGTGFYTLMYLDVPVAHVNKDGSINEILDNNFKASIDNGDYS